MGKRIVVRAELVDDVDPRELKMIRNDREDKEWVQVYNPVDFAPVAAALHRNGRKESGRVRV